MFQKSISMGSEVSGRCQHDEPGRTGRLIAITCWVGMFQGGLRGLFQGDLSGDR